MNLHSKLGDKKAFEIIWEEKQGKNREYLKRFLGTNYEENNFFNLEFKTRTKYSDQMLPIAETMINSFRFIGNSTKWIGKSSLIKLKRRLSLIVMT